MEAIQNWTKVNGGRQSTSVLLVLPLLILFASNDLPTVP